MLNVIIKCHMVIQKEVDNTGEAGRVQKWNLFPVIIAM